MKIAISGGGILGRLTAYALLHKQNEITLYDQNSFMDTPNCSNTAAGLLTPISEMDKAPLEIFHMGQESISKYWPEIISHLGLNECFHQLGSLVLYHPQDRAIGLQFIKHIAAKLGHHNFYQPCNRDDLSEIEPALTKFNEGYFVPSEGYLLSQIIMNKLAQYLVENQVTLVPQHQITYDKNRVFINNQIKYHDLVIDCRGLGAKNLFGDLRGVRGELLWVHAPGVNIQRPIRFLHPRYSLYLVPRCNHHYIIGASEIESEDETSISVKTTLELLTALYYLHEGFGEARIIKSMTSCRPTLSHHLPRIKYSQTCLAINGLYRHGFLLAPVLAFAIRKWLDSEMTEFPYPHLWEKFNDYSDAQSATIKA